MRTRVTECLTRPLVINIHLKREAKAVGKSKGRRHSTLTLTKHKLSLVSTSKDPFHHWQHPPGRGFKIATEGRWEKPRDFSSLIPQQCGLAPRAIAGPCLPGCRHT